MLRAALAVTLALSSAPALAEGDPQEGYRLARMCAACHGRDGVALRANTPTIAGLDALYIAEQLAAYRSGARVHPEMSIVAAPLADAQIGHLAAWFAGQTVAPD